MKQLDVLQLKLTKTKERLPKLLSNLITFVLMIGAYSSSAQNLNLEWGWSVSTENILWGRAVANDSSGNVYIMGRFKDSVNLDPTQNSPALIAKTWNGEPSSKEAIFLAKYNANGEYIWSKTLNGGSGINIQERCLMIDHEDHLIITFTAKDTIDFDPGPGEALLASPVSLPNQCVFLAKYDTDGTYLWAKKIAENSGTYVHCKNTDLANNIYIAGSFNDTADFDPGNNTAILVSEGGMDNFVAKYDKDGNYFWAHRMGNDHGGNGVGGIAVNSKTGDVITTGVAYQTTNFSSTTSTLTSQGSADVFVVAHDSIGTFKWAISFGNTGGDMGFNVAVDKNGNIFVVGYFQGSVDFDPGPDTTILIANGFFDAFLAKFDSLGNFKWAINVGDDFLNGFTDVDVDEIGNVYLCGFFSGSPDFDPGAGSMVLSAASNPYNASVAKYNANNGEFTWAGVLESSASSIANTLSVSPYGTVYVLGGFDNQIDLDPGAGVYPSTGLTGAGKNMYLIKLACGDSVRTVFDKVTCEDSYTLNGETFNASGTYFQHFSNTLRCDSAVILNLTIDPMDPPIITVDGFDLRTTQTYSSYQWIKDGVSIPGETSSVLHVSENGDYQVAVTNDDSCEVISAVYTVNNVGVEELSALTTRIRIYPNPTNNKVTIESPIAIDIQLISMDGRVILEKEKVDELSLNDLADGLYLLRIKDTQGKLMMYEKIVKQTK